jgi:hypothetical protein
MPTVNALEVYTSAAVEALMQEDDVAKFVAILREMESGLSKACRVALNREQPARVRCTARERELVLRHYEGIIQVALHRVICSGYSHYTRTWRPLSRGPAGWR